MMETTKKIFNWLFSINKRKSTDNVIDNLKNKMKITASCRYIACKRLQNQGKVAFFTTTVLSLGLIFVPLIQMTNLKLELDSLMLNAIQIFLAVSVLVYSVVIGTARYDFRSEKLNECADKIQDLILKLDTMNDSDPSSEEFINIKNEYSKASVISENHSDNDYLLSILRTGNKYTGIVWAYKWLLYRFNSIKNYSIPIILFLLEIVFILKVFGYDEDLINILSCVKS